MDAIEPFAVMQVNEFNETLNGVFKELPEFAVEGEITQLRISRNNAVFIEVKDLQVQAMLKVSNFAPWVEGLKQVAEGMQVVMYGKPEIYSPYGSFSFKVRKIEPRGEGALKAAFEKLQQELAAEGLFAVERKRELPEVVERIALITGKDSAAYADFTKILAEGKSAIEVSYLPVLVQGHKSEAEVEQALDQAQKLGVDAICLVRGGGSLEDLRSFNTERVARAIYSSQTPVIVGVGHEVDTTIADMVADVRASTPSQAAYYLISQNQKFVEAIFSKLENFETQLRAQIPSSSQIDSKLSSAASFLRLQLPSEVEVNHQVSRLNYSLDLVSRNISESMQKSSDFATKSMQINAKYRELVEKTISQEKLLRAYNPRGVLKRGYALARINGKYSGRAADFKTNEEFQLELAEGSIDAVVK